MTYGSTGDNEIILSFFFIWLIICSSQKSNWKKIYFREKLGDRISIMQTTNSRFVNFYLFFINNLKWNEIILLFGITSLARKIPFSSQFVVTQRPYTATDSFIHAWYHFYVHPPRFKYKISYFHSILLLTKNEHIVFRSPP